MTAAGSSYKGFRFPPEIISHCVWLYHRFPLSFRDVQELMLERGVDVSYETIRAWCDRFGQEYANQLRRRGPRPGDKWHLDEVFVQINGAQRYLRRAVDQHGNVLDILVQSRRNLPSVQHRRSKYLNNRAENSHRPTRQRERAMKRFKSIRHAQRVLSAFSGISPHFRPRRHLLSAADYRQVMADRFAVWNEITGATTTAAA